MTLHISNPFLLVSHNAYRCGQVFPVQEQQLQQGCWLVQAVQLQQTYTFLMAVPIMTAATGYDLLKNYKNFSSDDIVFFASWLCCCFYCCAAWLLLLLLNGSVS